MISELRCEICGVLFVDHVLQCTSTLFLFLWLPVVAQARPASQDDIANDVLPCLEKNDHLKLLANAQTRVRCEGIDDRGLSHASTVEQVMAVQVMWTSQPYLSQAESLLPSNTRAAVATKRVLAEVGES